MTQTLPRPRPEIIRDSASLPSVPVVMARRTLWQRLTMNDWLFKAVVILLLGVAWEVYGRLLDNPLLFPSFSETFMAFIAVVRSGELLDRSLYSLKVLLMGYVAGLTLAALLTAFAMLTRFGAAMLEVLTSMFNPLPAIALLPLALIWFGLGNGSLIFVLIHSVLWAVALNTFSGFSTVSQTLRLVGRNYGLRGFRFIRLILIPAALPSIITGMKIGWAFAWRTLIAAELVFGVSSSSGGLGWFIFENKSLLEIPKVFAGLFAVILIGLVVENLLFRNLEAQTIRRWGQHS